MIYAQPLEKKDRRRINKEKGETDEDTWDLFVPEFCKLVGITTQMQTHFGVMKEVKACKNPPPDKAFQEMAKKVTEITTNPEFRRTMQNWGANTTIMNTTLYAGRLTPPDLMVSNEVYTYGFGLKPDWASLTRNRPLQNPGKLMHWAVVLPKDEKNAIESFYNLISNAMTAIGVTHLHPKLIELNHLQNKSHYAESIPTDSVRFYLCFINKAAEHHYGKTKLLMTTAGKMCQFVKTQHVWTKDRIKAETVASKIALQICSKLKGLQWNLHNITDQAGTLVIGIAEAKWAGTHAKHPKAIVANTNEKMTEYASWSIGPKYITVPKQEFQVVFYEIQKRLQFEPQRIIIYHALRDENDLDFHYSQNPEYKTIIEVCEDVFGTDQIGYCFALGYTPMRFFDYYSFQNPKPGVIVDHAVTRPERFDFYLNSHVGPSNVAQVMTYYFMVVDKTDLSQERIKTLTFELCHLYANWTGTVKLPAVAQYAKKLMRIHEEGANFFNHPELADTLWFL